MIDIKAADESALAERREIINPEKQKPRAVRWWLMLSIGFGLLFLFFWIADKFYASLPQ